jgi:hypothetical protein
VYGFCTGLINSWSILDAADPSPNSFVSAYPNRSYPSEFSAVTQAFVQQLNNQDGSPCWATGLGGQTLLSGSDCSEEGMHSMRSMRRLRPRHHMFGERACPKSRCSSASFCSFLRPFSPAPQTLIPLRQLSCARQPASDDIV